MSRILKYVLWLAVAAAVVYGGYYAYQNWWNEGLAGDVSKQATEIGKTATQKAGEYAKSAASTTKAVAGSFLKSQIGGLVSVVGEQLSSFGAGLSGATSSPSIVGGAGGVDMPVLPTGNVPAPSSSAFSVPPPPATIVVKVKESLSFSINSGHVYKVNWGDGNKDQGATTAGSITVLNHNWTTIGDYTVDVNVGNSVSSNTYSFPIRVY
ncbi:hypothetical protein D4R51_00110 [bacterium]|nr:MAG: hypothetical protein D4R51_00110 [bacterium]